MQPKFVFGQKVYIRKGFYRGFHAEIKSFSIVENIIQATGERTLSVMYDVKVDNVPIKDLPNGILTINEEWLLSYKKWGIF